MKRKCECCRGGFSLIELLLAVTCGSVVMGMAVGLVHRSLVYQAATQARVEQASTFNRFAEQFRSDVHWATLAVGANVSLTLVGPEGDSIKYLAKGNRLECERFVDEKRQVEQVDLAQDQTAAFACSDEARFCTLEVQKMTPDNTTRTLRRIVSAVGLYCSNPQTDAPGTGETQ